MNNVKIYKNVKLGKNVKIEDFCIIGKPPIGKKNGELETIICNNALIRSHTVIYAGNIIGENFQTGHSVVIREGNSIGDNVSIGTMTNVEHHVKIKDNVRIHSQAFIPEYSILKYNVWIGPHVVLTNAKYPKGRNTKNNLEGPIIGENAKIGANTTLLPGIKIGRHVLIGAGSIVTKDVEDYKVAVGSPAKIIADIRDNDQYVIEESK